MTDVRFYHLQSQTLEEALPLIVEKALARPYRVVVMTGADRLASLDEALWTYSKSSFLPHGTKSAGFPDRQPVYLTSEDENPNGAGLLVMTDGLRSARMGDYQLCCDIFDGNDKGAVEAARERWVAYKADGHAVSYFQQDEQGRWAQKAAG